MRYEQTLQHSKYDTTVIFVDDNNVNIRSTIVK